VKTIATCRTALVRVHLTSYVESKQEVKQQICYYKLLNCPWKRLQSVT